MLNVENLLEKILDYSMTLEETKAWKIAILYLVIHEKKLPNCRREKIPKGDPRKSTLFKYAYTAMRKFNLKDEEWKYFVEAQIMILKHFNESLISPFCLVNKSSMCRYKTYKQILKNAMQNEVVKKEEMTKEKFKDLLVKSKEFLEKKKIVDLKENLNKILRWIALGDVTAFILVLDEKLYEMVKTANLARYNVNLDNLKIPEYGKSIFLEIFG